MFISQSGAVTKPICICWETHPTNLPNVSLIMVGQVFDNRKNSRLSTKEAFTRQTGCKISYWLCLLYRLAAAFPTVSAKPIAKVFSMAMKPPVNVFQIGNNKSNLLPLV